MNDVIVGVDRSGTARRAAEAAARLAAERGCNLHLVMCVDRTTRVDMEVGGDRFFSDSVSEAGDFLRSLQTALPHGTITRCVGSGDPAEMLCAEAARLHASTIVVGNRRVQGVSRVLGSGAGSVLRGAPCDVLIAQTTADDAPSA